MGRLNIARGALFRDREEISERVWGAIPLANDPFVSRGQSWMGQNNGVLYKASGSDSLVTSAYDAATKTWTQKANKPTGLRRAINSDVMARGVLYCFGGMTSTDTGTVNHEMYNTGTNVWSAGPNSPQSTRWSSNGAISGTQIMAVCGVDDGTGTGHTRCYVYDNQTNAFTQKAAHPAGGYNAGVAPWDLANENIIAGNLTGPPGEGPIREYVLSTNAWSAQLAATMGSGERGWGRSPDNRVFNSPVNTSVVKIYERVANFLRDSETYANPPTNIQGLVWVPSIAAFLGMSTNMLIKYIPPPPGYNYNTLDNYKRRLSDIVRSR